MVAVMREVRPQVVITFDPYGGYGHPDHIRMHEAAVAAFHAAGDPAYHSEWIDEVCPPTALRSCISAWSTGAG